MIDVSPIMPAEPDAALASEVPGKRIYDDAVFCFGGGHVFVDFGVC